jgi:lipoprotein-anchoring transpeptidase ErfK/SrfK
MTQETLSSGDQMRKNNPYRIKRGFLTRTVLMFACLLLIFSFINPVALSEEEEVYLIINTKKNVLTVMMNDSPIYWFPVASGRQGKTPIGEYRMVTKVKNPYYLPKKIAGGDPQNPLGSRWMGLNIGNGYKYGIHGTNRPSLIGHSVSSGCIRMRNKDVEYLFRHIPLKTRIVIIHE